MTVQRYRTEESANDCSDWRQRRKKLAESSGWSSNKNGIYYLHAEQTLPTAASGAARGEQPDYFWQPYDKFWAQERAERAACAVLCGACGGRRGHHCAGGAYCPSLGLAIPVCAAGLLAGDGTGDCRRHGTHSHAWGAGAGAVEP